MVKKMNTILLMIVVASSFLSANSLSDTEQAASIVNCINGNQLHCAQVFQSFYQIATIVFNSYLTNTTNLNANAIPDQLNDPTILNSFISNFVNGTLDSLNNWVEQFGNLFMDFINQITNMELNNLNSILPSSISSILASLVQNSGDLLSQNISNLFLNDLINNGLSNLPIDLANLLNSTMSSSNLNSLVNAGLSNLPNGFLNSLSTNQNTGDSISNIVNTVSSLNNITNNLNNNNVVNDLIKNVTNVLNNNGLNLSNFFNSLKATALTEVEPVVSNILEQVNRKDIQQVINQLKNDPNQLKEIKKGLFNLFDINKGKK